MLGPKGTIKIRAKLPSGQGLWPALWNYGGPTWPQKGEIDVMEMRGHLPSQFLTTLHWGNAYNDKTSYGSTINADCDLSQDWHEWSFVRSSNKKISFAFDGQTYATWDYNTLKNHASRYYVPFWDKPESVIFNLAVGGNFLPADKQPYPGIYWPKSTMEVDYIRWYDDEDHAPFGNLTDVKYTNIDLGPYGNVTMAVGASVHCGDGPHPPTPTIPPSGCVPENGDPWSTGTEQPCCKNLKSCLKKWNSSGYTYHCVRCSEGGCTKEGKCEGGSGGTCTKQDIDPYATGSFVQCCPQTKKCLNPWNSSTNYSYLCKACSYPVCKNSDDQCVPGDEDLEKQRQKLFED